MVTNIKIYVYVNNYLYIHKDKVSLTDHNIFYNSNGNILIQTVIASKSLVSFNISYSNAKPHSVSLSWKGSHIPKASNHNKETKGQSITVQINRINFEASVVRDLRV